MRFALFLLIGLVSSVRLPAQPTALNGPVQAYTFDGPTRSIRAVIGIPGAASFGPAVMDNLELASVAPGQTYGVVVEGGKCLLVSGLGTNKISTAAIAGITRYPDGIAWSANGSLAILYSRSGNWFQSVAGFPNAPSAGALVDLASLGGSLTAVAADPAGKQIAVGVSGDKGAAYEAVNDWVAPLVSMANPVSLSFSSDGQTLFALDAAAAAVTSVALGNHSFQTIALAGISNPVAIQSLQDSENRPVLYVAGGQDRILRMVDLASGQTLNDMALNFQPAGLEMFGSNSFVLAARSQSVKPLWLFSSMPLPKAYFVPAVQSREPLRRSAPLAGRTR